MGYRSQFQRNVSEVSQGDILLPILSLLLILIPLLVANLGVNHLRTIEIQTPSPVDTAEVPGRGKRVLYLTLTGARFQSEWVEEETGRILDRSSFVPAVRPLKNLREEIERDRRNVSAVLVSASPYLPYQSLVSALQPFQGLKGVPVVMVPGGGK